MDFTSVSSKDLALHAFMSPSNQDVPTSPLPSTLDSYTLQFPLQITSLPFDPLLLIFSHTSSAPHLFILRSIHLNHSHFTLFHLHPSFAVALGFLLFSADFSKHLFFPYQKNFHLSIVLLYGLFTLFFPGTPIP